MSFRAPRVVSHVTEKSQFCFNNLQKKKKISNFNFLKETDTLNKIIRWWHFNMAEDF